jgi:hypothetical protein
MWPRDRYAGTGEGMYAGPGGGLYAGQGGGLYPMDLDAYLPKAEST